MVIWRTEGPGIAKGTKIILSLIAILVVLSTLAFAALNSPRTYKTMTGWLSQHSGRTVALEGDVEFRLARIPRFIFHDVKIGNADWASDAVMFEAERIEVSVRPWPLLRGQLVMPELIVDKAKLLLEKNESGQANWKLTQNPEDSVLKAAAAEHQGEIPVIGTLRINDGTLIYRDAKEQILTTLTVSSVRGETDQKDHIFVKGEGKYKNRPFLLEMTGAPVLQLQETDEPFPFKLKTTIGDTHAELEGTLDDPVKLRGLNISLFLKGANAADLFPLTGIALPPTPPYHVRGHLTHDDKSWNFRDFKGQLGSSDLSGDVAWYPDRSPPYFNGTFTSEALDMKDLAGFIGAHRRPQNPDRVIPDQPLDITRLLAMNADAAFRGKRVKTPDLLDNFAMAISLQDGVLWLKPISFGMAKGRIDANVTIEGLKVPPVTTADISFRRLSLNDLFRPLAKRYGEQNVSAGLIGGKAVLKGNGKSLHDILATSSGTIGIGMEGGQLSRLLLETLGLDLFKAAGLILTGDKPVAIHCIVGDFTVASGIMQAREFLVDTDVTTIRGEGRVNLKNENIDFRLNVYPKDATLISLRSPILVRGMLKRPVVGIDPAALATRGGLAAVLGALLTPVGALLAFVEPGLGQDSNCVAFLQQLERKTGGAVKRSR